MNKLTNKYKSSCIIKSITKFLLAVLLSMYTLVSTAYAQKTDWFSEKNRQQILSMIPSSPVIATIKEDTPRYLTNNETAGRTGIFQAGDRVEILKDKGAKFYFVRLKEKPELNTRILIFRIPVPYDEYEPAWVKAEALEIPPDEPAVKSQMTNEQLEAYAYFMNFESKTPYFVLTDISRQTTHIFTGKKGAWQLLRSLLCSTGKNESPTTRGLYKISERGNWFYSERLQSGARFWVRFNGSYLFHSIAMDMNKNIVDNVLGEKRSMGCVRFSLEDAEWFHKNIPEGTGVYIN